MAVLAMPWGRMAYAERGAGGVPLVFLHGSGCDSEDWNGVLNALPADQCAVTMDFRAHGGSDAPERRYVFADLVEDVLALVERLRPERVILVGHSLGGMVAIEAAGRSSRVAGLVLVEGWTRLAVSGAFEGDRFYGRMAPAAVRRVKEKSARARARVPAASRDHFWLSLREFDGADTLASATIPVFEVYGALGQTPETQDRLCVPPNPKIEWVWVPDAGHYLPHEKPDAVAEVCLRALEQV